MEEIEWVRQWRRKERQQRI